MNLSDVFHRFPGRQMEPEGSVPVTDRHSAHRAARPFVAHATIDHIGQGDF